MVTEELESSENLKWPAARFVASQVSQGVRDTKVRNPSSVGHRPFPPSFASSSYVSPHSDSIEYFSPMRRRRRHTRWKNRRQAKEVSELENDDQMVGRVQRLAINLHMLPGKTDSTWRDEQVQQINIIRAVGKLFWGAIDYRTYPPINKSQEYHARIALVYSNWLFVWNTRWARIHFGQWRTNIDFELFLGLLRSLWQYCDNGRSSNVALALLTEKYANDGIKYSFCAITCKVCTQFLCRPWPTWISCGGHELSTGGVCNWWLDRREPCRRNIETPLRARYISCWLCAGILWRVPLLWKCIPRVSVEREVYWYFHYVWKWQHECIQGVQPQENPI